MKREELRERLKSLQQRIARAEELLRVKKVQTAEMESRCEAARMELLKAEEAVQYARNKKLDIEQDVETVHKDIEGVRDLLSRTRRDADVARQQVDEELAEANGLETSIQEQRKQLAEKGSALAALRDALQQNSVEHESVLEEQYKKEKEFAVLQEHAQLINAQNQEVRWWPIR